VPIVDERRRQNLPDAESVDDRGHAGKALFAAARAGVLAGFDWGGRAPASRRRPGELDAQLPVLEL
jgi:hypothetical protein